MHEHGVRTIVIDKIMGWAPRTTRDRHYIRIATRAMRDAILTLYRTTRSAPSSTSLRRNRPNQSPTRCPPSLPRRLHDSPRLSTNWALSHWTDLPATIVRQN
jgi:hypothetical protein